MCAFGSDLPVICFWLVVGVRICVGGYRGGIAQAIARKDPCALEEVHAMIVLQSIVMIRVHFHVAYNVFFRNDSFCFSMHICMDQFHFSPSVQALVWVSAMAPSQRHSGEAAASVHLAASMEGILAFHSESGIFQSC